MWLNRVKKQNLPSTNICVNTFLKLIKIFCNENKLMAKISLQNIRWFKALSLIRTIPNLSLTWFIFISVRKFKVWFYTHMCMFGKRNFYYQNILVSAHVGACFHYDRENLTEMCDFILWPWIVQMYMAMYMHIWYTKKRSAQMSVQLIHGQIFG